MCILKPKCEYIFKADQIIFQKLADKKCSSHFSLSGHMAYHAGGRRSVVNPGTELWRPPVYVTQFWPPRSSFGARFW